MEILHVSAECYPMAKAGGLGDVVGALPKYQNALGHVAKVVMPMYRTQFLYNNEWVVDAKGSTNMGNLFFDYTIIKEQTNKLGFDLYLVDINGLTDREKIYGYNDDTERFTAFQIAVLHWVNQWEHLPSVIHCHDHHTGLIPFMMKYSFAFAKLAQVPSIVTIHNAQYQGWMGWDKSTYIPAYDTWKAGLLEWAGTINPLASAVKCSWAVTTVSWSYLEELRQQANGLEALFEYEKGKCYGILNGIDADVWDPATDNYLTVNYDATTVAEGKAANKAALCERFGLQPDLPLFVFIGRLVGEKAADVLPDAILSAMYRHPNKASFLILGSGDPSLEDRFKSMASAFTGKYNAFIGYNEALSHLMYAGADFLLMPSRVEPCGLNQMYAMKYGTVAMVRNTGGLRDTVTDMGDWQGWGIRFNQATAQDVGQAIDRAIEVFNDTTQLNWMRQHMMQIDHSWESSVQQYIEVYQKVGAF
jgi:starch synthase